MHMMAAEMLAFWADPTALAEEYVGRTFDVDGNLIEITEDHCEVVQDYVTAIRFYAEGALECGCEFEVDIGAITGEHGATGTIDYYVITADGEELQIHDLKTGWRPVHPTENRQLSLYAAAMLHYVGLLYNIKRVRLVVHQPRIYDAPREWSCPPEYLESFAVEARGQAAKAIAARKFPHCNVNGLLTPGVAQCEYCSAKPECPALDSAVFSEIAPPGLPPGTTRVEIVQAALATTQTANIPRLIAQYRALPLIAMFCKAIGGRMYREVLSGTAPGYKIVKGRKGARKWTDAESVEQTLQRMRLKREQMYKFKLISPTAAEKLLKATAPKRWAKLQDKITRPEGRFVIAPVDDPREVAASGVVDFEDLTNGGVDFDEVTE